VADMIHNSDLSRLDKVTEEDLFRREKYQKAITFLSEFTCEKCEKTLPLSGMGEKSTRKGEILCQTCLVQYEIDYDEYEDWLKGE
jgi:transcription elongation factor Elf1